jgi:hypothetical protein
MLRCTFYLHVRKELAFHRFDNPNHFYNFFYKQLILLHNLERADSGTKLELGRFETASPVTARRWPNGGPNSNAADLGETKTPQAAAFLFGGEERTRRAHEIEHSSAERTTANG